MTNWLDTAAAVLFVAGFIWTQICWFRTDSSRSRFEWVRNAIKDQKIAEDMTADQCAAWVMEYSNQLRKALFALALTGLGSLGIAITAFGRTEPAALTSLVIFAVVLVRMDAVNGIRSDARDFLDFLESVRHITVSTGR